MIYDIPPVDFNPIRVAECFIEYGNQVLFLRRSHNVPHPGVWALPGGKLMEHETAEQAVCREVLEECSFVLIEPHYSHTDYIRYPEYDYTCYVFRKMLKDRPNIKIDLRESDNYAWLTMAQVKELDEKNELIVDEMSCIERVYKTSEFGGV